VDGNKEMMAIGMMNIVGSCSSCYVTTGKEIEDLACLLNIINLLVEIFQTIPLVQ